MMRAQISAIEYHLPDHRLTNDELARIFPDWSSQQIREKVGIECRRIAAPDETAADLAVKAAQRLFASGKATPSEIDFLLFCSQCSDYLLPASACMIQNRLGLPTTVGAYDLSLGCSGFIYGLATACGMIESGIARSVLLLTADTYSRYLDPQDRSVRALFGDGAAATVIRGVAGQGEQSFLGPFIFGTDGAGSEHLIVRGGGMRTRAGQDEASEHTAGAAPQPDCYLRMNGPAIFTFALQAVPAAVQRLIHRAAISASDVDLFVFHQANGFMLEALRTKLQIEPERFVVDLGDKGNTVSSSIPIALARARTRPGAVVMLVGFGVGLSWAATLARLPSAL